MTYECAGCGEEFTHEPTIDSEQRDWLGDAAPTFCSADCLSAAGERQATR